MAASAIASAQAVALPEGFQMDAAPQAPQSTGLPEGFQLDEAPSATPSALSLSNPAEAFSAGAAQGALGQKGVEAVEQAGVAPVGSVSTVFPKETDLSVRVANHLDYYGGYVMGRTAQLLGLGGIAKGAMGAAGVASGVTAAAGEAGIQSAMSEYSDTANAPRSVYTGLAGALIGGAIKAKWPGSELGKTYGASNSISEGAKASHMELGMYHDYMDAIGQNKVMSDISGSGNMVNNLIQKVAKFTTGSNWTKITTAMDALKGGMGMDAESAVLQTLQSDAEARGTHALSGFQNGLTNTLENIKGRKDYNGLAFALRSLSPEEAPIAQALASDTEKQLNKFSNTALKLSEDSYPVLEQLQNLQATASRQGGSVAPVDYVVDTLNSQVQNSLRYIESEMSRNPTISQYAAGMGESMGGMENAKAAKAAMDSIIDLHQNALNDIKSTPLMSKVLEYSEAAKNGKSIASSNKELLMDLLDSAEQTRRASGDYKTYAQAAIEALDHSAAGANPKLAEPLLRAKQMSVKAFLDGDYEGAISTADKAMNFSGKIKDMLSGVSQTAQQTMVPKMTQVFPNPMANLPAIAQYQAGRASLAGARKSSDDQQNNQTVTDRMRRGQ